MAYERVNVKPRREWRPFGIQARNSPPSSLNLAGFRWIIRAVPQITSLYSWHRRIRLCASRIFAFHATPSVGADRWRIAPRYPGWRTRMRAIDTARFCTERLVVFNREFFNQFPNRRFFSSSLDGNVEMFAVLGLKVARARSTSKLGAVLNLQFCA